MSLGKAGGGDGGEGKKGERERSEGGRTGGREDRKEMMSCYCCSRELVNCICFIYLQTLWYINYIL